MKLKFPAKYRVENLEKFTTDHFLRRERPRRLSTSPATVAHMQSMTRAESDSCLFMNPVDAATTNSPTPAPNMTPMAVSGSAEDILAPLETREEKAE